MLYEAGKRYVIFMMKTQLRAGRNGEERIKAMEFLDNIVEHIGKFESIEELQKYIGTNNKEQQIKYENMTEEEWEEHLMG